MPSPQPTRSGKHREERRFDQTFLSSDNHGNFVHRDYIAHCERWSWVGTRLFGRRVLDVGCGPEAPLAKLLIRQGQYPKLYVGVDLNEFEPPIGQAWSRFLSNEDFVTCDVVTQERLAEASGGELFDDGVCFEVIEHMEPEDGFQLLANFHRYIRPGGHLYLSTPVFDGKAAVNHIHEYTIIELQDVIEAAGWRVIKRYGTFANLKAIEKVCTAEERKLIDELRTYHCNDFVSAVLAFKYPDASRNNLWVLERS